MKRPAQLPSSGPSRQGAPDGEYAGPGAGPTTATQRIFSVKRLGYMSAALASCGLVFGVDVVIETLIALRMDAGLAEFSHIMLELLATALLAVSTWLTIRQLQVLRREVAAGKRQLTLLRTEFDKVIANRFQAWRLSHSEQDVALLTIKGLSIHDIADTRQTREGTIKAQLSMIFRKAGVSSRTELLALFMDELLDFGSTQDRAGLAEATQTA